MEDETIVGTEDTLEPQTEEVFVEEVPEESIDDIRARLTKAEELAKNQKIRAEKAEARLKEEPRAQQSDLTASDILAIAKAGVEPEDLDEIVEYAKFKNIPIHQAIKSPVIKATLAEKTELRKSAEATNTSGARRASTQVSDERLLANAKKGDLPDSEEDLKRLIALQMKARRS